MFKDSSHDYSELYREYDENFDVGLLTSSSGMSGENEIPPGYRWLKCDLHTHTPASCDTPEMNGVTESEWLSAFMKNRIDLVAITDHNTGRWIDP